MMAALSIVNLEFLPSLNVECIIPDFDYINKMLITTLAPIGVCVLIVLVLWPVKRSLRQAVASSIPMILTISFLAFIMTSSVVFGYFKEDEFVDIGQTYLELDYTVDVHQSRYTQVKAYAVAMLFVYPIGTPALYFVLLFRQRGILKTPIEDRSAEESGQVAHLSFLASSYRPAYWYV